MNGRIGHKRDTDAALAQSGVVPLDGELVLAELDGEVRLKAGDGVRTYAQLPFLDASLRKAVEEKADADHTHFLATEGMSGFMSSTDKAKLDGVAENANFYTHPSYTSRSSGLYKMAVDSTGHVSSASPVTKSDITALGIPGANTTYGDATTTAAGLMSASDKRRLDSLDVAWIYAPSPSDRTVSTMTNNADTTFGNTNILASGIYYVWLEFWADTVANKYMAVYIKCTRGSNSLELAANTYSTSTVQAGTISGFFPLTGGDSIFFNVYQNCGKNITFRWRYGILRLKKT